MVGMLRIQKREEVVTSINDVAKLKIGSIDQTELGERNVYD